MYTVVVGANRGIGLEFCKQLVEQQHKVVALCRKASKELSALDCQVIEGAEVTDKKSMKSAVEKIPFENIDWLIHVSGIARGTNLETINEDDFMDQFNVNSLGPLICVNAFLGKLSKDTKVGLLTSRMGSIADNDSGGSYGYRMSKAALNAAGKSLALDLKDRGIAVFLLHPGWVKTEMTNHNGLIEAPESVTGMIKIMKAKSLNDTGTFWHTNGEQLPW